jgi:hypothetical protein
MSFGQGQQLSLMQNKDKEVITASILCHHSSASIS